MREVLRLLVALEERGDDRSYGPGVGRAVGVAAGLAVDRADVQAGAAADAVEGLLELRAQEVRAAVVQQDQVKLLSPVELALSARAGHEVGVDRELLARPAPRQEASKHGEVLEARDELLYPHHHHVDRRDARHEPPVPLVRDRNDRTGFGDAEVRPRDANIRREELLAQASAGEAREDLRVRRQILPRDLREDLRDPLLVHVQDGPDDVRRRVAGELGDPLSEVRLHDLEVQIGVALLQAAVELYLLGRHALRLGDDLRPASPGEITDVPDDVLAVGGEVDVPSALLDGPGHLFQIPVEVRHRLLLYPVRPLAELGGLGKRREGRVARRQDLVGEELQGAVQGLVPGRPAAALVETFDGAFYPLAAVVRRVPLAGGLPGLHP